MTMTESIREACVLVDGTVKTVLAESLATPTQILRAVCELLDGGEWAYEVRPDGTETDVLYDVEARRRYHELLDGPAEEAGPEWYAYYFNLD